MRDPNEDLQFVKLPAEYLENDNKKITTPNRKIEHIQINFYGIKTDSPSTKINVSMFIYECSHVSKLITLPYQIKIGYL